MRRLFLFIVLMGWMHAGHAQTTNIKHKPDMKVISEVIRDSLSADYYPDIMKLYKNLDTSLTFDDFWFLYYGFTFQPAYQHAQTDEYKLMEYMKKDDAEGIKKEAKFLLHKNPFCLLALYELSYIYHKTDPNGIEWKKYRRVYNNLRKVIIYSGDGQSCETAFKVLSANDEYNIIRDYLHIQKINKQVTEGGCDKFEIEPSANYNFKEIYFDISSDQTRTEQIYDGKD